MSGTKTASAAVAALALLATPTAAASLPRYLDDVRVDQMPDWLAQHNLDGAFAAKFQELQYDGEMLTKYIQPSEIEQGDFPDATRAHKLKLLDRIEASKRPQERRRLETQMTGSGISILRNNSHITLGANGDVTMQRTGESELSLGATLLVQDTDVVRLASGVSAGGVGWDLTHPGAKNYLIVNDVTLPQHWTVEFWVKPVMQGSGHTVMSFASEDDVDCFTLDTSGFNSINDWHHIVVSYDRWSMSVHDNGVANNELIGESYCGDYTGSLVFGQAQGSLGGGFQWAGTAQMYLDTVAIYNRAFDLGERRATDKFCVDVTDPSLVHLWTGYTRGTDQIGGLAGTLALEGFSTGASEGVSCSVEGNGVGTPGDDYSEYAISHTTSAVGAVGWLFPGGSTEYHFVADMTLPPDFTIAMWVYPLADTSGTYFLSWASDNNNNCMILAATEFSEIETWYHVVVTWDGLNERVYMNGEIKEDWNDSWQFCGDYTGALSIGQEQDSVQGGYDASQAAALILDTVSVYRTTWDYTRVQEEYANPCINLGDPDIHALYSGYSKGKDLVGSQDGTVTCTEVLSPGQPVSDALSADLVFEIETCDTATDQVEATAPDFDNTLVGGIGWDIPGDSTSFYFATQGDFTFPDEFTVEFWAFPRSSNGYMLSYASSSNNNCMIIQNSGFPATNTWYHVAITYDGSTTTAYLDGVANADILHSAFCGDHEGGLVLGQEQDSVLGGYDVTQTADCIYDTLAVYSTSWDSSEVGTDRAVGVDLSRQDLFALWSGVTRGKDLVGSNDATVYLSQFTDGMPNSDANAATLDMLSPVSVGGVAWDFPGSSVEYYIATDPDDDFNLPTDGFTIETWVNVKELNSGYWMSYAAASTDNCLLLYMNKFTSDLLNEWHHAVITYDSSSDTTSFYLDGELNNDFIHSSFCGSSSGVLVVTQEQDSVGGGFSASQSAAITIDTIAIYSQSWDETTVNERLGQCVNLHDPTLFTLWSGFTRGKDLVGNNDASIVFTDWVEGASLDCDAWSS